MTLPSSSISGLISGFNYRDLVDAIIAQARTPATRWEAERSAATASTTALATYRGLLDKVRTAARTLRDGTAFDAMSATTTVTSGTRPVVTATASATATPGSYSIQVEQLARAAKYASSGGADGTAALGQTGSFTVNGQAVTVEATDSLATLRDKVNALNAGTTPTNVAATLLTVGPGDVRLILTATKTGADGLALADTAGTTLQSLGILDGAGDVLTAAILTEGADAAFRIDGILMARASNVVSDAISGVTLTLTADDTGAATTVEIGRFLDAARSSMQGFVTAYNELVAFLKAQGTATESNRPALYGQSLIRTARAQLPALLLESVGGAAADLATVSRAGLSLTRDGTLTFDAALFETAFTSRQGDLRALFTEQRTASGADLEFVSSTGASEAGSRAVEITALATRASLTTTGFAGLYDAGGSADSVTVTDGNTGRSTTVALTTGMTTGDIVAALQAAFDADGLGLTATADGNEIRLDQQGWGSAATIGLAFAGLGDGGAEAWSGDVTVAGTDLAGTIGGATATGVGQLLVGNAGGDAAGLTVRYTGAATGAVGDITLGLGTGARIERLLDQFLTGGSGLLDAKVAELDLRSARLERQISELDARLERRRAVLLQNFLQMEASIARLRQQSSSLLNLSGNGTQSS